MGQESKQGVPQKLLCTPGLRLELRPLCSFELGMFVNSLPLAQFYLSVDLTVPDSIFSTSQLSIPVLLFSVNHGYKRSGMKNEPVKVYFYTEYGTSTGTCRPTRTVPVRTGTYVPVLVQYKYSYRPYRTAYSLLHALPES